MAIRQLPRRLELVLNPTWPGSGAARCSSQWPKGEQMHRADVVYGIALRW